MVAEMPASSLRVKRMSSIKTASTTKSPNMVLCFKVNQSCMRSPEISYPLKVGNNSFILVV